MNESDQIYCRAWTSTSNGYQDLTEEDWGDLDKTKLHRTDGPAVICLDGHEEWWQNGKRHRENGPATIYKNGTKHWWQNYQLNRIDGPAVIYPNGYVEWWIKNKSLDTKQVEDWIQDNNINLKTIEGQTAFKLRWS